MPSKIVQYMKAVGSLTGETLKEWFHDNAQVQGAALAFYTLFSLAPLLIILTAVVGHFLGQEAVRANLLEHLAEYVGTKNAQTIITAIQGAYKPGTGIFASIIAILLMIFGTSSVFLMLKSALNSMWNVSLEFEGYFFLVLDQIKSFLTLMLMGLLLFISIVVKTIFAAFYKVISSFSPMLGSLLEVINQLFTIVFLSILFAIVYKVLPDVKVPTRYAVRGAIVTAVLFSIGNIVLGLYLTRQSVASAYGAAGSLVVILLWVYYSSLITFLGAEFTQVYACREGHTWETKDSSFKGIKKFFSRI
jgi:membrane protein